MFRTGSLDVSPSSSRQSESHEPLSSQLVYSLLTDNGLDTSPQKAPVVCQSSLEVSLPGAAEVTPIKFRKKSDESLSGELFKLIFKLLINYYI